MRTIYLFLVVALLAMPASATVRYVDANQPNNAGDGLTWATAHKHLQSALSAATDGDQIWVARGIYKPTDNALDRTASFVMKEGVAIYGGFTSGQMNLNDRNSDPASNGTVLSGDIDGDGTVENNSLHILYSVGGDRPSEAFLDGFVISGGNDYDFGYNGVPSKGSAMYIESSSPTINRCLFEKNNAREEGGAIYSKDGSPRILNCTFRGNVSAKLGGAIYSSGGSPFITGSVFEYNITTSFDGGAVYLSNPGPSAEIRDSKFLGNQSFYSGGAIYKANGSLKLNNCSFELNTNRFGRSVAGGAIVNSGRILLNNCQFTKNSTSGAGGAIITAGNDCEITNCVFKGNNALLGGGAISSGGNLLVTNTLFQDNSTYFNGGAFYNRGSSTVLGEDIPKFVNCSFVGNTASGGTQNGSGDGGAAIYNSGKGSPQLTNCALWDNGGANTFSNNEQDGVGPSVMHSVLDASVTRFGSMSPSTNILITQSPFISDTDARLRPGSPAIDAGLNSANATATDLAGNQRIINGTIDMGAYEFGEITAGFAITGVVGADCQALSPTARQLTFTPTYQGSDGSPITFGIYNEMPRTQAPGPYSLRLYTDNPTITLTARQGSGEEVRYQYDWLAACASLPKALAIVGVSGANCQTLSPTARKLNFTPVYEGGDGSPITFSVYGEMVETQAPGPYDLRLYIDNPSISLIAQQGNNKVRFQYDWLTVCNNAAARSGVGEEPGSALQLTLLGNPVNNGLVKVEIRGAQGQPFAIQLMDMNGKMVGEHHVKQPETVESHAFEISQQPAGILLLRVSKPDQTQTIKVLNVH